MLRIGGNKNRLPVTGRCDRNRPQLRSGAPQLHDGAVTGVDASIRLNLNRRSAAAPPSAPDAPSSRELLRYSQGESARPCGKGEVEHASSGGSASLFGCGGAGHAQPSAVLATAC